MRFTTPILALAALAHSASAHYIFNTVVAGGKSSSAAVRQPANNSPVLGINDPGMTCNSKAKATDTLEVAAGSAVSFQVDVTMFHKGTGALYLGKAPGKAADWDGSGSKWFKIADVGPTFNPFAFPLENAKEIKGTIPSDIEAGEYLLRVEHTALHAIAPEWYVSCAQLKITGGGNASPATVNIPGQLSAKAPGLTTSIYSYPVPTSWIMPGPPVYTSGSGNGGNNNSGAAPSAPSDPSEPSTPSASDEPTAPSASPSPTPGKTCNKKRSPPSGTRLPRAVRRHARRQH